MVILDNILRYLREKAVIKNIPENSIVCDVGCRAEPHFLKKISNFISYGFGFDIEVKPQAFDGIDFSKNRKLKLGKINLEKDSLPLGEKTIDVVTMIAVLEHLENPDNVFKESFRVLRPGGLLILTSPSPKAKPILNFSAFKLKIIDRKDIKEHKKYYSSEDIKSLLLEGGFQSENLNFNYFEFGLNILVVAKR